MTANPSTLQKLFEPRSVAVYGASDDRASIGYLALSNLKLSGFSGPIVPINPRYKELGGLRCYSSAREYDGPIDLGMCVVSAARVMDVIEDCVQAGIETACIYAAGFAEVGGTGESAQRELSRVATKNGMRIIGPNCYGYANGLKQVSATIGTLFEVFGMDTRGLGIVSQSGAIAAALMNQCKARGVDVGFLVSTGNEMDVDVADCIEYLCDSPSITRIALYLEGVRDVARLRNSLARARRQGQDVIVLRAGRTGAGKAAVISHTASLVTDARLYEALFRELGAVTVSSLREMTDMVQVSELRTTAADAVAIVTSSGAGAALAADACEAGGVPLAVIPSETQAALKALVPHSSTVNPIDMTGKTSQDPEIIRPFISALLDDPTITHVAFMHASGMRSPGRGERIASTLSELATKYGGGRLIFVGDTPDHIRAELRSAKIPIFEDPVVMFELFGRVRAARMADAPAAASAFGQRSGSTRALLESTALAVLEAAEVPVVARTVVEDEAGVRAIGSSLGSPLVAKAVLPDVTHKASIGAIRSGLGTASALVDAWTELAALARGRGQSPRVLVESQVQNVRAEMLIAAFVDPILGPFVGLATGGAMTELVNDIVFVPMPVASQRVRRALEGLRVWPAISRDPSRVEGFVAEVATAVSHVQELIGTTAHDRELGLSGRIVAIEINPYLLSTTRSCAVDAVIEVESNER